MDDGLGVLVRLVALIEVRSSRSGRQDALERVRPVEDGSERDDVVGGGYGSVRRIDLKVVGVVPAVSRPDPEPCRRTTAQLLDVDRGDVWRTGKKVVFYWNALLHLGQTFWSKIRYPRFPRKMALFLLTDPLHFG